MKTRFIIAFTLLWQVPSSSQGVWELLHSIPLSEECTAAAIDPEGRLYIGTSSGNLHRFSSEGQESELFSAIANLPVTSVSAWNRLKVFLFFRDPQEFYYLNRFNTLSNAYALSEYEPSLSWLCSPGVDNSLWVLNIGYNELRKYNDQNRQLQLASPLTVGLNNATHMRAYQNFLIISDSIQGMYIFDQYANLLRQVDISGINHFQVLDKKILFYSKGFVHRMDLYNPQKVEKTKAPSGAFFAVFQSGSHYVFVTKNKVLIYQHVL